MKLTGLVLVLFAAGICTALAADPVEVVYGTYLGGSEKDGANAIALRPDGGVYVAGGTPSRDVPTTRIHFNLPLTSTRMTSSASWRGSDPTVQQSSSQPTSEEAFGPP